MAAQPEKKLQLPAQLLSQNGGTAAALPASPFDQAKPARQCRMPGCPGLFRSSFQRKYRICSECLQAPCLVVDGVRSRFCQQCGCTHPLDQFDAARRNCRSSLTRHSERRKHREQLKKRPRGDGKRRHGASAPPPDLRPAKRVSIRTPRAVSAEVSLQRGDDVDLTELRHVNSASTEIILTPAGSDGLALLAAGGSSGTPLLTEVAQLTPTPLATQPSAEVLASPFAQPQGQAPPAAVTPAAATLSPTASHLPVQPPALPPSDADLDSLPLLLEPATSGLLDWLDECRGLGDELSSQTPKPFDEEPPLPGEQAEQQVHPAERSSPREPAQQQLQTPAKHLLPACSAAAEAPAAPRQAAPEATDISSTAWLAPHQIDVSELLQSPRQLPIPAQPWPAQQAQREQHGMSGADLVALLGGAGTTDLARQLAPSRSVVDPAAAALQALQAHPPPPMPPSFSASQPAPQQCPQLGQPSLAPLLAMPPHQPSPGGWGQYILIIPPNAASQRTNTSLGALGFSSVPAPLGFAGSAIQLPGFPSPLLSTTTSTQFTPSAQQLLPWLMPPGISSASWHGGGMRGAMTMM